MTHNYVTAGNPAGNTNDELLTQLADTVWARIVRFENTSLTTGDVTSGDAQAYAQNMGIFNAITAFYSAVDQAQTEFADPLKVNETISAFVNNAVKITYVLRQLAAAEFSGTPVADEVTRRTLEALPAEAVTFFDESMAMIVDVSNNTTMVGLLSAALLRRLEAYIYATLYIKQLFEQAEPVTDFDVFTQTVFDSGFDISFEDTVIHIDPKRG